MTADIPADACAYQSPQMMSEAKRLLSRGVDHARDRQFERAIALFTQVIHLRLNTSITVVKSYYHRGCALCSLKRYAQAVSDFTQVIQYNDQYTDGPANDPRQSLTTPQPIKPVDTYIHRGSAHRHLGNHQQAFADLTRGIQLSNGSAQSYGARGLLRLDMEEFANAIADFDQALSVHPTFAQGYLWRGFAWVRSAQYDRAQADLTHAIAAIPNCASAYNHRGVAHFYLNLFTDALVDFDRAIQCDSQFAEAYNNRGTLRQLLGDRAAAVVDFDTAIALNRDSAEPYLNRAATLSLNAAADNADAAADYDKVVDLSWQDAVFYRHRARVRASQARFDEAIADYTAAIELTPTAYAHYHRGLAYLAIDCQNLALADFDCAIALSPDYGAVYCERAQLRFNANDLSGALSDMDKALTLNPPPSQTRLRHLYATQCLVYFCLGAAQKGLAAFEQLSRQA
ncbi:MAG: tetratricopeptide repeat protein [Cyanobacteria bacterium P01_A01_bin.116]